MLQIPSNLSEAARIDGANEFQIIYQIILPLTRPALVVVALLAGVNAWNDFLGPLIYLQNDKLAFGTDCDCGSWSGESISSLTVSSLRHNRV